MPDTYRAALAQPGTASLAERWLAAWNAWNEAGRPSRLRPPDFSNIRIDRAGFAERLDEIEEELTAPDVPAEDSG